MKKLVIGAAFVFVAAVTYEVIIPALTKSPCEFDKLQVSTLDVNMKDRTSVKLSMTSAFGSRAGKYAGKLKSAQSNTVFRQLRSKPWASTFSTTFRSQGSAKKAYNYLKRKWGKKKHVSMKGKTVSLHSNYKFKGQCFAKLLQNQEAIAGTPKNRIAKTTQQPIKKKTATKRKAKKKTRRVVQKSRKSKKKSRKRLVASKKVKKKKRRRKPKQ